MENQSEQSELDVRRKKDLENLAQIPTILAELKGLSDSVKEIKDICNIVGGLKTDVEWLKKFFWVLTGGVVTALGAVVIEMVKR